jgi:hypothetical protein
VLVSEILLLLERGWRFQLLAAAGKVPPEVMQSWRGLLFWPGLLPANSPLGRILAPAPPHQTQRDCVLIYEAPYHCELELAMHLDCAESTCERAAAMDQNLLPPMMRGSAAISWLRSCPRET